MSEKYDIAQYLANLLSIMDSKESTGLPKGATLVWEYNRTYDELRGVLDKEKEDEARKSEQQRTGRQETGADRTQGVASGSGSAGASGGNTAGERGPISWQGGSSSGTGGDRGSSTRQPRET